MEAPFRMNLIAAVSKNMGIGYKGIVPWNLPNEFKYFQRITKTTKDPKKQNAVVMGRITWEGIPVKFRPLPGRINVIVSREIAEPPTPDVFLCRNFDEVIDLFTKSPLKDRVETIFNVGGNAIYRWALENHLVDFLYLTRLDREIECDSFFPDFNHSEFELISLPGIPDDVQEEIDLVTKMNTKYRFEVYRAVRAMKNRN